MEKDLEDLEFFDIDEYSSHDILREKYLTLVKKYHPDANSSLDAQDITAEINERYSRLKNFTFKIDNSKQSKTCKETKVENKKADNFESSNNDGKVCQDDEKCEQEETNPVLQRVEEIKAERGLASNKRKTKSKNSGISENGKILICVAVLILIFIIFIAIVV